MVILLIRDIFRSVNDSDGTRSKNFDPGQVNFLLLGLGWVESALFGLGLSLENFLLKISIFSLRGQKKSHRVGSINTWVWAGAASYLLWVRGMLGLGQGPSLLFNTLILVEKAFLLLNLNLWFLSIPLKIICWKLYISSKGSFHQELEVLLNLFRKSKDSNFQNLNG